MPASVIFYSRLEQDYNRYQQFDLIPLAGQGREGRAIVFFPYYSCYRST